MLITSVRSNDKLVAVESSPELRVTSVKSREMAGVVVPLDTSSPVPTVTFVTVPAVVVKPESLLKPDMLIFPGVILLKAPPSLIKI